MASLHSEQYRNPVAEGFLWIVWETARCTGGAALVRRLRRELSERGHRLVIRAELLAADLLTGPVVDGLDTAQERFSRRAPYILAGSAVLVNLLYLGIR